MYAFHVRGLAHIQRLMAVDAGVDRDPVQTAFIVSGENFTQTGLFSLAVICLLSFSLSFTVHISFRLMRYYKVNNNDTFLSFAFIYHIMYVIIVLSRGICILYMLKFDLVPWHS